jgi:hypothetical protein
MLIAVVPIVIALIGVLLWCLAANAKLVEIGKWMFIIGLFWFVGALSSHTWRIIP